MVKQKQLQPKEPITVIGDVIQSGNSQEYRFTFPTDAQLNKLRIHCYEGQEFDMQYRVYHYQPDNDRYIPLTESLTGSEWIGGNDDVYTFDIRKQVDKNDEVVIEVKNTDSNGYPYHTNLHIGVDYQEDLLEELTGGV